MPMTISQIIDALWLLPVDELANVEHSASRIRALKSDLCQPQVNLQSVGTHNAATDAKLVPSDNAPNQALLSKPSASRLASAARAPLRPPKEGSLRHDVHAILREAGGPLRRADIIAAAATKRGVAITESLRCKIGDILCSDLETRIHRVAHGVYRYQPGGGH